jgi:carboxyl-terminal processing protease
MRSSNRKLSVALLLLFALGASAQTPRPAPAFKDVFEDIWQTVNSNFYDPNFAGVDWNAIKTRYAPQVERVKDEASFLELMSRMLKELPVSHLRINAPAAKSVVALNARLRLVEGARVVTALPSSAGAEGGLRVGDAVLTPWAEVTGAAGSAVTLRVSGCDGKERELKLTRAASSVAPEMTSWRVMEPQPGKKIGYFRVARFEEGTVTQIDDAMRDLKETAGLVVDLRGNPGGTNSFVRLISYLVPGQQFVSGLLMRPFMSRYGGDVAKIDLASLPKSSGDYSINSLLLRMGLFGAVALYTEDMGEKAYRGKVVILSDGATASAAEGFIAYMTQRAGAVAVGRTTAGQLLTSNTFHLVNGWTLVVPIAVPLGPDKKLFKDTPLAPQETVSWTRLDVCGGRDPDVERAVAVLTRQ